MDFDLYYNNVTHKWHLVKFKGEKAYLIGKFDSRKDALKQYERIMKDGK